MRRRLQRFLPIVLIAVLAQIFAPIGVTWAASIAASDPLHAVPICHGAATSAPGESGPSGQSGQSGAHQACCSVCSVVHGGVPLDGPPAVAVSSFYASPVVWFNTTPDLRGS